MVRLGGGGGQIAARRSVVPGGRSQGGAKQGTHMLKSLIHCLLGVRIAIEQASNQRRVAEVGQQGAVPRQQELLGIVPPKSPRIHFAFEVGRSASEEWLERDPELHMPSAPLRQCLPSHETHEVRVGFEELEPGSQDMVDLIPTIDIGRGHRRFDSVVPLDQGTLEHFSVEDLLRREVMQQALPPHAHLLGDEVERRAIESTLGEESLGGDDGRLFRCQPGHDRDVTAGPPRRCHGAGTVSFMEIISALFIDEIDLRQVPGPATRIDLTGVQFSAAAPAPLPFTWAPHLVVIIRCPEDGSGQGVLEVTFHRGDEQVARSVQPFDVEPGKFTYRLVRAELEFEEYGTVEARCRINQDPHLTVPYTILPPPADS